MTWWLLACGEAPPAPIEAPDRPVVDPELGPPAGPAPAPEAAPAPAAEAPPSEPPPPATGIVLGVGRIAVLDPGFHPSAVTTTKQDVLDVSAMAPVLLLMGSKAGTSTVTVERAGGGDASWDVEVVPGDRAPAGGPGLLPPGDELALPVGGGAVCSLPNAKSYTRLDEPSIQVLDFGAARWFVQVDGPVHGDLAFEMRKGPPVVLPVTATTGEPRVPALCSGPSESVEIPLGQEVDLPLGRRVSVVVIGDPSLVHAASLDGPTDTLRVTGVREGATTLAARSGDTDAPVLRTLVVASPR